MSIHHPNQLTLDLERPHQAAPENQAAYPNRSPQEPPDLGIDAPPLAAVHEVLIAASTAPPELAKRARQDLAAQLADLARERGRHPVPKHPGAEEVMA